MIFRKKLITFALFATIGVTFLQLPITKAVNISVQKRVVVISTKNTIKDIDTILNKYDHKKIKKLSHINNAQVIMVGSTELQKLRLESNLQVYDDALIHVLNPKENVQKTSQQIPWGIKYVQADQVWKNTTGKGIKVAVIDSGVAKHEDLKNSIKGGYNAIDLNQSTEDDYGHGTHIAGIIAARNDNKGVVGVAPDSDIYAVKVLDSNGSGYVSDLAEGIEWCISNDIKIINLSVEILNDFPILRDSIKKALDSGIIIVAAAGNTNGGSAAYPAAYADVISVNAIDEKNNLAYFSSIGKIDYCAPGVNIFSTYLNEGYTYLSGTSMAAPHVTGIVALMLADEKNDINNDGKVSKNEVVTLLSSRITDVGSSGYDNMFGNGILKAK